MSIHEEISLALQSGKRKEVLRLVQEAIDAGESANSILENGLMAGMAVVGDRFTRGEAFIPEVLVAARCMNGGSALLKPLLAEEGVQSIGKACIGTVQGDLHDIGKNLVAMMLESKGIEVVDLGVDIPAEKFVECAVESNCDIICCSALLTTTMPEMAKVVEQARGAGIRDKVKIMIGGAPVTQEYCDKIGADCYAGDAAAAAVLARELLTT